MKKFFLALFLILFTVLVFFKSLPGQFIGWDDEPNITSNPYFITNSVEKMWREPYLGMYIPLTYTVWGEVYQRSHGDAESFKILNLVIHIINTLLVFWLFLRCLGERAELWSFLGALLFALHPLQVDAVSWITGGRDLLASFFSLLAIHCFFTTSSKFLKFILAPALFLFGLLCKPGIIALPLALMVYELIKRRFLLSNWKNRISVLLSFLPWFAIALPCIWITASQQQDFIIQSVIWWQRPLVMLDTYGFYLEKFFYPLHLMANYERLPLEALQDFSQLIFTIIFTIVLIILMFYKRTKRHWQIPGTFFFILLLPISGVASFAYQNISGVADHYFYLASVPLILGLLSQAKELVLNLRPPRQLAIIFAVVIVSFLGFLSYKRSLTWQSDKTFSEELLKENSNSFTGHTDLAKYYFEKEGNLELAEEHADMAFRLKRQLRSTSNLFAILYARGKYEQVVIIDPDLDTPDLLEKAKLSPALASNLFLAVGLAWRHLGKSDKSFLRLCQAYKYNRLNQSAVKNLVEAKSLQQKQGLDSRCE